MYRLQHPSDKEMRSDTLICIYSTFKYISNIFLSGERFQKLLPERKNIFDIYLNVEYMYLNAFLYCAGVVNGKYLCVMIL